MKGSRLYSTWNKKDDGGSVLPLQFVNRAHRSISRLHAAGVLFQHGEAELVHAVRHTTHTTKRSSSLRGSTSMITIVTIYVIIP
jgi:hypothetical protein